MIGPFGWTLLGLEIISMHTKEHSRQDLFIDLSCQRFYYIIVEFEVLLFIPEEKNSFTYVELESKVLVGRKGMMRLLNGQYCYLKRSKISENV